LRPLCEELARRVADHGADVVCGPLEGGAFVAHQVAAELGVRFTYTRREPGPVYTLPSGVGLRRARAIVVDDAVNFGSAVISTAEALVARGCRVVGVASVLACLPHGPGVGARLGVPQTYLHRVPGSAWEAAACPLCRAGIALSAAELGEDGAT
jgi:orotate phosphoribosyltransferase